jgi:hypothetical protein
MVDDPAHATQFAVVLEGMRQVGAPEGWAPILDREVGDESRPRTPGFLGRQRDFSAAISFAGNSP